MNKIISSNKEFKVNKIDIAEYMQGFELNGMTVVMDLIFMDGPKVAYKDKSITTSALGDLRIGECVIKFMEILSWTKQSCYLPDIIKIRFDIDEFTIVGE